VNNPNKDRYLHIKVPKPAGFVSLQKISHYITDENAAFYRDPRQNHSNLYADFLPKANHSTSYKLRAETSGTFTALPAEISAMYDPEICNNTDKFIIQVTPKKE